MHEIASMLWTRKSVPMNLLSYLLFMLLSCTASNAQGLSTCPGVEAFDATDPTQPASAYTSMTSVVPDVLVAGHTYNVLMTGSFITASSPSPDPNCAYIDVLFFTFGTPGDWSTAQLDPYVTDNNNNDPASFISLTQTMASITVASNAPAEKDVLLLNCAYGCAPAFWNVTILPAAI